MVEYSDAAFTLSRPSRCMDFRPSILVVVFLLLIASPLAFAKARVVTSNTANSEVSGSLGYFHAGTSHPYFGGEAGTTVLKDLMVSGEFGIIPVNGGNVIEFEGLGQYLIRTKSKAQPFIGVGMGLANLSGGGVSSNSFKVDFGGGVRYFLGKNWGARSDFRIGRYTGFQQTTVRFTGGLFYSF